MPPAGAFKTTTRTATAEQRFWRYGGSAHRVATSSTASAIDLIRRDHLRRRRLTGSSRRQDEHACAIQRVQGDRRGRVAAAQQKQ